MSVQYELARFALVGIPFGLGSGLLLGLAAGRADPEGRAYSGLPRRAARLGHVAAVMLPLIAGLYSLLLDALDPAADAGLLWASRTWQLGSVALVAVLFATSWKPVLRWLLPLPATALTAASVAFALAGLAGGVPS